MHVEGDEIVLDAVTCAACGAKVREDRPWCLRCGKPLVAASEPPARRLPLGTFAVVAACLSLVGVAAMLTGGSSADRSPAPAGIGGEPVKDGGVGPARREQSSPEPGGLTPDPSAVAFERRVSGVAAYGRGDLASALDAFSKAVEADPDNADALNNLGQVLARSGRPKEAIPHFDQAIAIAGDRWAYHFNRARAYADLREWAGAVAGYGEAARLFPDDYVTQFNLARARQASGDLAGAIAGFERAIQLAPGEADFHLSYANALDRASRAPDAAVAYRRYLGLNPGAPQAEKIKARIAQLGGTPTPR